MANLQVMLQHGWAIVPSIWIQWLPRLNSLFPGALIHSNDRGYKSGSETDTVFEEQDSFNILITHSLGLHFVSQAQMQACHMLVIVGGFLHFHNGSEKQTRLSKIIVRKMLEKLDNDPLSVLADFYRNCGFAGDFVEESTAGAMDFARIKDDLILLNQSALAIEDLCPTAQPEVLILHSDSDAIVPVHHAHELRSIFKKSTLFIHPSAGHALPHTDPDWCITQIQEGIGTQEHADVLTPLRKRSSRSPSLMGAHSKWRTPWERTRLAPITKTKLPTGGKAIGFADD